MVIMKLVKKIIKNKKIQGLAMFCWVMGLFLAIPVGSVAVAKTQNHQWKEITLEIAGFSLVLTR